MTERLETLGALRARISEYGREGLTLGFVPTMGALHAGHLKLVEEAKKSCDRVIVSIFVNPKQFAPHEDFATYPRTVDADIQKLQSAGADAVYLPDAEEIYPEGFSTKISVSGVTEMLEGEFRPHFFEGVTTVVAKLFLHVLPDKAFFGEKDYQQLQVVRRMASDLSLPVEIVGVEIVRDEQGLALSSRNAYLTVENLEIARQMNKVLFVVADKIRAGENIRDCEVWGKTELKLRGFNKVDYFTVRNADNLEQAVDMNLDPKRVLAAAWLDKTRLIDNVAV